MSEHGKLSGLSDAEYFASPGVTATALDYIRRSPAHCRAFMAGELSEESPALTLGSIIHDAILRPSVFAESYVVKPDKMKFTTKKGKAWRKAQGDKQIITHEQNVIAQRCRENVMANPIAAALFSGGEPEQALLVEDAHGTLRRSRFDYWTNSGNAIADLKTTTDASADAFERSILKYNYHCRAAFYLENAALAGFAKDLFVFVAVETSAPYLCAVYTLNDAVRRLGEMQINRDMTLYRQCVESGKWPGYHEGAKEIGLPPWAMRGLEELV